MGGVRVTAGSRSELEHVYREHGERLWRAVLLFSGDREVANDAVAEAFAQALRRGGEILSPENWVWRTAFRVAAGLLKEQRKASPMVERPYEMPDTTADLVRALKSLSDKQRSAVVLHYYGDFPIKEVATLLGSSASAVGVHLHRARKRLRTILEETDD